MDQASTKPSTDKTDSQAHGSPFGLDPTKSAEKAAELPAGPEVQVGDTTIQGCNVRSVVDDVLDHFGKQVTGEEARMGLATGFDELDRLTNGLQPGKVFVIASRPSMGKTSLMLNIVDHICIQQKVHTRCPPDVRSP